MKKYFRYISFLLVFVLSFSKNYVVKANALVPELVETGAKYVIAEGLIATGVTFGAPIVAGVTATAVVGYAVNDYIAKNPQVYAEIKASISSGVTSVYKLSDDVWNSIRSYSQSKYKTGSNTYVANFDTFKCNNDTYTYSYFPVDTGTNGTNGAGYYLIVNGSKAQGVAMFDATNLVVRFYTETFGNLLYVSYDVDYDSQYNLTHYGKLHVSNKGMGGGLAGTPIGSTVTSTPGLSYPYFGSPSLSNPSYDYTNPNTKDRDVSFPTAPTVGSLDLGSLVGVGADSICSTPVINTGTGDTGTGDTGILQGLWDWLKGILQRILDGILAIPAFFVVDWSVVKAHMDYTSILTTHFKPFYDISSKLQNIQSNPAGSAGKFYMKIPSAMGGDDSEKCVLDLTVGSVYITWARTIIKYSIWIGLLWYILRIFQPKLNM